MLLLGELEDLAHLAAEATSRLLDFAQVDHQVDRVGDERGHRLDVETVGRLERQVAQRRKRRARRASVDRGQAALVTGVHRSQDVECLSGSRFAEDDAGRLHTQRVLLQEITQGDETLALCVLRTALP